jgi:hypothetical protein
VRGELAHDPAGAEREEAGTTGERAEGVGGEGGDHALTAEEAHVPMVSGVLEPVLIMDFPSSGASSGVDPWWAGASLASEGAGVMRLGSSPPSTPGETVKHTRTSRTRLVAIAAASVLAAGSAVAGTAQAAVTVDTQELRDAVTVDGIM